MIEPPLERALVDVLFHRSESAIAAVESSTGIPTLVNAAWRALFVTSPWQDTIHAEDRARCVQPGSDGGGEHLATEVDARLLRSDGETRWHRLRFTRDPEGARWFVTATDIDQERRADEEREEEYRVKDRFLVTVSHDLRAPLAALLLWEQILRDNRTSPELRARAIDAIHDSAIAQSRLVGDLLDVSRALRGKLFVDLRPTDIVVVLRAALDHAAPSASEKRVVLYRDLDDALGEVNGDAGRLRQILDNLIANAVNVSDEGGRVSVSARRQADSILIVVEGVFDPFDEARDNDNLGLAVAHELVSLHHGTLDASSDGVGRGSRFTVTLPAMKTDTLVRLTRAASERALEGVRVLVVDDDPQVRDALALLLERVGAIVVTAASAASARAQLVASEPEALVCDIGMPGEDGYELIASLRASGTDTPAIAVTAHASELDVSRALAAGFDVHLAKPIDLDRLIAKVRELVVARRARTPATPA
ncbi:MAG: response regulator [Deltaproteobacteria bacterium]|nr:response regulator [Deltaproteobacteria bacterium]